MNEIGLLRAPATVLFGDGLAESPQMAALVRGHGARAVICTDPMIAATQHLDRVVGALQAGGIEVQVAPLAVPELPLDSVTDAIEQIGAMKPDCLIALGGGSCIDLAKLVAVGLSTGQPLEEFYGDAKVPGPVTPVIAIPTTAGTGSEVTPVAVLSDPRLELKVGVSSQYLVPRGAICDPRVTMGAPAAVTAYAGIDALAHAIEAYTAVRLDGWDAAEGRVFVGQNILGEEFALRAVRRIHPNLEAAMRDDLSARAAVLEGSLCAGLAFGTGGTAVAHALQYPVGARTKTPHGLGIGLLLPYAMRFNSSVRAAELTRIAEAIGCSDTSPAGAVEAVRELALAVGVPATLAEIGLDREELPELAERAMSVARLIANNPRPVDQQSALEILDAAWHGEPERITPKDS